MKTSVSLVGTFFHATRRRRRSALPWTYRVEAAATTEQLHVATVEAAQAARQLLMVVGFHLLSI